MIDSQCQSATVSSVFSRRHLLANAGCGAGMLGLAGLLQDSDLLQQASAADVLQDRTLNPLAPADPHFQPRATRVIWIFINGGPSPVDTWNYRPALTKWDGKSIKEFDSERQGSSQLAIEASKSSDEIFAKRSSTACFKPYFLRMIGII